MKMRWQPHRLVLVAAGLLTGIVFLALDLMPRYMGTADHHFYAAQAQAMLHGRLDVHASVLRGECFMRHGSCYGYFGITPSLLRLPFVAVGSAADMSRVFMLLALTIGVAAALLLLDEVLLQTTAQTGPFTLCLCAAGATAVGPGTLLWQSREPNVYEEPVAWAAALTTFALWVLLRWLRVRDARWLVAAAVALTLAANARFTAVLPALLLGVVVVMASSSRRDRLAGCIIGVVPAATVAGVLVAKFGTVRPSLTLSASVPESPTWAAVWAVNGGHDVSVRFVPTSLVAYLRPDCLTVAGGRVRIAGEGGQQMPYFWPLRQGAMYVEPHASITALAAGAALLVVFAAASLLRERTWTGGMGVYGAGRRTPALLLLAGASGVGITVAGTSITNRYLVDFWPLLVTGVALGSGALLRMDLPRHTRMIVLSAIAGCAGLSAAANLALASPRF
jgi:hypothetical protein